MGLIRISSNEYTHLGQSLEDKSRVYMYRSKSSDEEPALLIQEIWADTVESDFLKAFLEHPSLKVLKETKLSWSKRD